MKLIYQCNECGHKWDDLNESCPKCNNDTYTIIENDGPGGNNWLKYSAIFVGVLAIGLGIYYTILTTPPPPEECDFKRVNDGNNSFVFECNCDDITFKSLSSGRVLYSEGQTVFPCQNGEIEWSAKNSNGVVFKGEFNFTMTSEPHKFACEKECDLIAFNSNKLNCDYNANVSSACRDYVQISFDKEKWNSIGKVNFTLDEVGDANTVYAKFSNERSGAIDELTIESCEIIPMAKCASEDEIKQAFEVWINNLEMDHTEVVFLKLVQANSSNPVYLYNGKRNHLNDLYFDLTTVSTFDNSKLDVVEVVYNSNKTQILEVKLNQ